MSNARSRNDVARAAADALESRRSRAESCRAVVGFDAFIDSIIRVVDTRRSMAPDDYEPIRTIPAFAARAAAAAGKSTNMELVVLEDRFGGNGPLLASALGCLGAHVSYVGAVGRPESPDVLHPLYETFAARCERVVPVAPPAHTDALEFEDGKIMLGKPAPVQRVTWARLIERVGLSTLRAMVTGCDILGMVNWVMMAGVEGIWRGLIDEVLPHADPARRPRVFIDLADPAKRTDADLRRALALLREMNTLAPVTLGLNLSEAERLAQAANARADASWFAPGTALADAASSIRAATGLDCVVIHPREGAAAADTVGNTAWFDGPFTASPRLSTGAGDHFNGGFILARTLGLPVAECLAAGCAESGAYVRDAESPSLDRLIAFLRDLPTPDRA